MRKKLKYKFIFLLVIVLTVSLFYSSSCGPEYDTKIPITAQESEEAAVAEEEYKAWEREREEREQAAEEAEQREKEQAESEEAELLEGFEEEEKLIPNEPITYSGDVGGIDVVLIVNFKTKKVSGSINYSGDSGYVDATIDGEIIDIDNFEIKAKFSGKRGWKEDFPFKGTINGTISNDLSTFKGDIWDDETGWGGEFTATK